MAFEFKLADLGEGITEAEIRGWLVGEGDWVAEHQAVVEVETDKAVVEIPTPEAGRVIRLHYLEGAIVPVGATLLSIETGDAVPVDAASAEARPREKKESFGIVGELPEAVDPARVQPASVEVKALPAVRALAKELGVGLDHVAGTGPEGSIRAEDVRLAATRSALPQRAKPVADGSYRKPMRAVRRTIARNLLRSQQLTAFVTNMDEFDVTRLWELKQRERPLLDAEDLHLTFLPFFIQAVQHALTEFPRFNARIDEESNEVVFLTECHMGVAVDTEDGLMVPVVRDIGQKSILDLARELQALSQAARDRSIAAENLQGSTITLTNFGSYGGQFATPILNYPNVAIVGCGRIRRKPWIYEDEIAIRQLLPLSLTFDHRITDGAEASRFLNKVGRYLENPGLLFLESV
ncbi:MAG: 2-oxo acid dehydrogenase subunit E2 [Geopsychrobacter sp.]|nr:2-oxo acid dehydrogenase subunit E2 [Geopsychrobacter sp.]